MDDLPLFVMARLFVLNVRIRYGLLDIRTPKVLLWFLLSDLGGEFGDNLCGDSFQGFCDTWDVLTNRVCGVFVEQGGRRSTALRSWCTSPGSKEGGGMDGRRNGGGLDLCLIVVQLDSTDLRGSNRFSLWELGGEEPSEDGEKDLGEDASVKGKNAKHEVDELPDHPYPDRSSRARSQVGSMISSGPGFGSCLTGPQVFLGARIWGRFSGKQGGFNRFGRLVVSVMDVNRGNRIG